MGVWYHDRETFSTCSILIGAVNLQIYFDITMSSYKSIKEQVTKKSITCSTITYILMYLIYVTGLVGGYILTGLYHLVKTGYTHLAPESCLGEGYWSAVYPYFFVFAGFERVGGHNNSVKSLLHRVRNSLQYTG